MWGNHYVNFSTSGFILSVRAICPCKTVTIPSWWLTGEARLVLCLPSESEILRCVLLTKTNGFKDTKQFLYSEPFSSIWLAAWLIKILSSPSLSTRAWSTSWFSWWMWWNLRWGEMLDEQPWRSSHQYWDAVACTTEWVSVSPRPQEGWVPRADVSYSAILRWNQFTSQVIDVPSTALCLFTEETGGGNYWMKK